MGSSQRLVAAGIATLAIALGAGAIAQYSMTGLVRAQFGTQLAGTSR